MLLILAYSGVAALQQMRCTIATKGACNLPLVYIHFFESPGGPVVMPPIYHPVDPGFGRPPWNPVDPGWGVRLPVDPGYRETRMEPGRSRMGSASACRSRLRETRMVACRSGMGSKTSGWSGVRSPRLVASRSGAWRAPARRSGLRRADSAQANRSPPTNQNRVFQQSQSGIPAGHFSIGEGQGGCWFRPKNLSRKRSQSK